MNYIIRLHQSIQPISSSLLHLLFVKETKDQRPEISLIFPGRDIMDNFTSGINAVPNSYRHMQPNFPCQGSCLASKLCSGHSQLVEFRVARKLLYIPSGLKQKHLKKSESHNLLPYSPLSATSSRSQPLRFRDSLFSHYLSQNTPISYCNFKKSARIN